MSKFEIIATLITIVFGLMLANLFTSLHKLIKSRKIVKWHWLPLLNTWFLFILILTNWWSLISIEEYNMVKFLAYGHLLILLYLSGSIVLPDKIQKKGINLKEYYFQHHRYYWGLMAAFILISKMISIVTKLINSSSLDIPNIIIFMIYFSLNILLAISRRYWIHSVVLIFFTLMIVFEIVSKI
jgi:hypothetical protein